MAIGFMSFGGMLTGGEEEVKEEQTVSAEKTIEENVTLSAVETSKETKTKVIE